jgi:hypothetical protein
MLSATTLHKSLIVHAELTCPDIPVCSVSCFTHARHPKCTAAAAAAAAGANTCTYVCDTCEDVHQGQPYNQCLEVITRYLLQRILVVYNWGLWP